MYIIGGTRKISTQANYKHNSISAWYTSVCAALSESTLIL